MKLFKVAIGTDILVISKGASWLPYGPQGDIQSKILTREIVFELEAMIIDPVGIHPVALGPTHKATIGGWYAHQGWYGFDYKGHSVLVRREEVEVL